MNGALGTVVSIKAHHIAVLFDNVPEPYRVEKVKSKFMVLKKIFVYCKQFPLILAFAVTIHKCQGLSLDCAMMELSDQVYVTLSRVKQLENLHLHCKNIMVISTLSGLSQLHLFRGCHSTPHHAVLSWLKWPLHFSPVLVASVASVQRFL